MLHLRASYMCGIAKSGACGKDNDYFCELSKTKVFPAQAKYVCCVAFLSSLDMLHYLNYGGANSTPDVPSRIFSVDERKRVLF